MNRERELTGSNGYARELGLNPLDLLLPRMVDHDRVAWLDLCCGTGRALVEAGKRIQPDRLSSRLRSSAWLAAVTLAADLTSVRRLKPPRVGS